MIIKIHSAEKLEKLAKTPFPPKTALISISDPGDEPVEMSYEPDYVLRLAFDDVSLEEIIEGYSPADMSEETIIKNFESKNLYIFTQKQAQEIAEFIIPLKSEIDLLICQCYYGESRSAGCAAAITEFLYGKGIEIFADYKYCPNKRVYHKLIEALREIALDEGVCAIKGP
jgi:predicted protein tyrosine phosphatase